MNVEVIAPLGKSIRLPDRRILPLHTHPEGGQFAVWEENGRLHGWRDGVWFEPTRQDAELYVLLEVQTWRV